MRPLSIPATGIGRYCRELLTRLIESPHEWFLYTDRPLVEPLPDSANVVVRHGDMHRRFLSTPYAQLFFPVWAKQDEIDLFWSPRHHLPICLPASVKKVVSIHDLVWMEYPETMTRFGKTLERCLMPRSIRVASKVICSSYSTERDVGERFCVPEERLHAIPLASFIGFSAGSLPVSSLAHQKKPYILSVGTLEPRKNLKASLQAFANLVHQTNLDRHFYLIGATGWGDSSLIQLISDLKVEDRVTVLGRLTDEELRQWYAGADVFLMPSLYEGFGLPLVEAMSFGVPVITSNISSMPEVAGDGGILVDPFSVDDIQGAIRKLCSDADLRSALSLKAKARAEQFSWDKAAEQTLAVLESAGNG